jgi:hypothetical protein
VRFGLTHRALLSVFVEEDVVLAEEVRDGDGEKNTVRDTDDISPSQG